MNTIRRRLEALESQNRDLPPVLNLDISPGKITGRYTTPLAWNPDVTREDAEAINASTARLIELLNKE